MRVPDSRLCSLPSLVLDVAHLPTSCAPISTAITEFAASLGSESYDVDLFEVHGAMHCSTPPPPSYESQRMRISPTLAQPITAISR